MRMKMLAGVLLLLACSGKTWALCEGGYPNLSVAQEARDARLVVIARPQTFELVRDVAEDPDGYVATRIHLAIDAVLRGMPPEPGKAGFLTILNPNTSARFPMDERDAGTSRLLFIREGEDGYWVDSCGHSGKRAARGATIRRLRQLGAGPR